MNIMEHQTSGMFVWGVNKSSALLRRNQKCAKYIYLLLIRHCALVERIYVFVLCNVAVGTRPREKRFYVIREITN